MLTALIIISLISLLIATEAEPASSPVDMASDQPMRPKSKTSRSKGEASDRLAA